MDQQEIHQTNGSVRLQTNDGDIIYHYHPVEPERARGAVIWVGGAGGGLDGPAGGLYPAACQRLQPKNIAGLRLHYHCVSTICRPASPEAALLPVPLAFYISVLY